MRKGLDAYRATGAKALVPQWMVVLADLYGKSDQVEQGLAVLADLQPLADSNEGEHYYMAEMLRLKGQLLIQGVKDQKREAKVYNEGEACFQKAIELSQQQNAKSLELRAAASLSQLWQTRGRKAEAFGLLDNIYKRFEEGFGTPDLVAAKLLLEQLA